MRFRQQVTGMPVTRIEDDGSVVSYWLDVPTFVEEPAPREPEPPRAPPVEWEPDEADIDGVLTFVLNHTR